jgi:hypothetical protein
MLVRMQIALFAMSIAALIACDGAPPSATTTTNSRIFATYPAGEAGLEYRLTVDTCRDGSCPLLITLVRKGAIAGAARLKWPSPSKDVRAVPIDNSWGAGDSIGAQPGLEGWTANIDNLGDGTVVRPIALAADRAGVLITQRMGTEPIKRWHALFSTEAGSLKQLWAREEGAGPTWSSSAIVPFAQGAEQVLYFEGYAVGGESDDGRPDTLESTAIRWQDGKLEEMPASASEGVLMLWFGPYATVAAANEARSGTSCLFRYWILDGRRYAGLPDGYILGAMGTDRQRVQAAQTEAAACAPKARSSSTPLQLRR